MAEVVDIIPPELIKALNEEQILIEEESGSASDDFDFSDFADEDAEILDEKPDFLEQAENGEGGFEEEEIEGLSEAFLALCIFGKDLLTDYYEDAFVKRVKKDFEDEKDKLSIMLLADQEDKLSLDGISETLKALNTHTERFHGIVFADLVPIYTRFKQLKKRYTARPLQPYQEEGLKRYFKLTMLKYFQSQSADPLAMLVLYLLISFGFDGYNLYKNYKADS